jgi:hypothetical protein
VRQTCDCIPTWSRFWPAPNRLYAGHGTKHRQRHKNALPVEHLGDAGAEDRPHCGNEPEE